MRRQAESDSESELEDVSSRVQAPHSTYTAGGMPSNLPPLGFHSVHGENIRISSDGSTARRVESFCKSVTFSARPVRVNERVCIRIVETSKGWIGGINFGFTTHDPATLAHALPKYTCPDLSNKPGNWVKPLDMRFCKEDIVFYYYVNSAGDVHFGVNGEDQGSLCSGVDTKNPLWALVDVFANCTAVQFTDLRVHNQQRSNPIENERLISGMRSLSCDEPLPAPRHQNPVVPLSLHTTAGRNVQFATDRGVAARIESDFCQGYVFTAHPMRPGQIIVVQILATVAYEGSLAIGLTSCDPALLRPSDLPDNPEFLLDRPEYWVVRRHVANGLRRGDELAFTLTFDGEVKVSRNCSNPNTVMLVDHTVRLWAFVDIYGNTQKVRMLSLSTQKRTALGVSLLPQNDIANNQQGLTLTRAHYEEFQENEKRRNRAEQQRLATKHNKAREELRAQGEALLRELEQYQNEKRKALVSHESNKLKAVEERYAAELRDWRANLPDRKAKATSHCECKIRAQTILIRLRPNGKMGKCEYQTVSAQMQETVKSHPGGTPSYNIVLIEKVQNCCLWKRYRNYQQELSLDQTFINEKMLFHGSNAVEDILKRGFDERHSNTNGMFGAGIYFAQHSSKSNQYTFGLMGGNGCKSHADKNCKSCNRKMLLCRVALGRECKKTTAEKLSHPPPNYHSVVGTPSPNGLQYPEYVIYRGEQAYPEYVITYTVK